MERKLNSVGKACFVKYYWQFADSNSSNTDIVEIIHHKKGYTIKACKTRVSEARSIIDNELACDASELIMSSSRLGSDIIAGARKIYTKVCSKQ